MNTGPTLGLEWPLGGRMSLPNMRRVLVQEYSSRVQCSQSAFSLVQPTFELCIRLHKFFVFSLYSVSLLVKHRMLLRLEKRSTGFQSRFPLQKIDDEDSRSRAEVGKGTDVVPCPWPSLGAFLPIKCTAQAQKYHVQNSKISLTRFA